ADGAPVEDALVGGVLLAEHAVERDGLPRAGVEVPGDAVGAAVGVADDAPAPRLARHAGVRAPAGVGEVFAELDGPGEGPRRRRLRRLHRGGDGRGGRVTYVEDGDRAAAEVADERPRPGAVDDDAARRLAGDLAGGNRLQVHAHQRARPGHE